MTPKPGSTQQRLEKLRAVLASLPHNALVDELISLAEDDKLLLKDLLLKYDASDGDKFMYSRMVNDALDAGRGRYDFIDYWGSSRAAREVESVLGKAEHLIDAGHPAKAIPVLQAVIEEVVKVIAHADDSNGDLGGCISQAFNLLETGLPGLNQAQKHSLFTYCLTEAAKEYHRGWDWQWDLLGMAERLIQSREDRERLFDVLDHLVPQTYDPDGYDRFTHQQAAAIKLAIIEREDGQGAAQAFLVQNAHLDNIRQKLVQLYIQQGNYVEARRLCQESIDQYEKKWPGLVHTYEHYLMTIAQATGNTVDTITFAEKCFMSRGDFQYYDVLKQLHSEADWSTYLEFLVRKLQEQRSWMAPHIVAEVFVHEGLWDRLLALIQKQGVSLLSRYQSQMEERYPNEICDLYVEAAYKQLERTSDRGHYQAVAQLLARMKSLGASERVVEIVDALIAKYPRRVAMIDELKRIR